MHRIRRLAGVVAKVGLTACTSLTYEQQGAVTGAALGVVAEAGIAAIAGESAWKGAAVGAVAGGIAGRIRA